MEIATYVTGAALGSAIGLVMAIMLMAAVVGIGLAAMDGLKRVCQRHPGW